MRTTTAVAGSIVMLVVGVFAVSQAAESSRSTAMNSSNAASNAWNVTTDTFSGVFEAAGPGIVWMGVGAIVLVSLGFLAFTITGGR